MIDIDCLCPSFAPSTGTPKSRGLTTNQGMSMLDELYDLLLVEMDCVKVAPAYNHKELTSNASANFVQAHLCSLLPKNKKNGLQCAAY